MKQTHIKWIIVGVLIAVIWILIGVLDIGSYLTFESLYQNKVKLSGYVSANYGVAVLTYIGVYITVIVLALPGAAVMTIGGGVLFGVLPALVFANIAATTGATISFLMARYLIGDWVQNKYKKSLIKFNQEMSENGKNYLLTLRLIPIFPFFMINLASALTKVSLFTFAWTTSLGIIPGSFAYALAGNNLSNIQSAKGILSKEVIVVFVILGILSLAPPLAKKYLLKKNE